VPKVLRIAKERKVEEVSRHVAVGLGEWDVRAMLLQTLIPLGIEAARRLLEEEVMALAGPRYARHDGVAHRVRWGRQRSGANEFLLFQIPDVGDSLRRDNPWPESHARDCRLQ
jgi:hypothetical protein